MERLSRLTRQEIIESYYATGEDLAPDRYPELGTLSDAFIYQFTPVAKQPASPEVVFLPTKNTNRVEITGVLASWNHLWEAGQYRKEVFREDRFMEGLPDLIEWIEKLPEANIYLVADSKTKFDAYAPLYHLLPKRLLDRHGLPALKRGLWPRNMAGAWTEEILPHDFPQRLSRALAETVFPYLQSGSCMRAFSSSDSLVLLSHDLDFWLPYAVTMMESRMREFGRVEPETDEQRRMLDEAKEHEDDPDVGFARPRKGGILWIGEEEADYATEEMVDAADRDGRLRGIVDAIRSNRVVDDFSPRWSFAREDFERKLYCKRAKVRVSFVELKDTLPVHSPRSEYTDNLLWQDFSALLDRRERHVVVCLRNGTTKLGDIAAQLGYANHSPISKALARIRKKAQEFLN
jgi:hypothetical protein